MNKKFKNSTQYWEERYNNGGNSGAGSYNNLAEFKTRIINNFIEENNISNIIEFGCGDGNQLKGITDVNYLGFDVSDKAINICKELFKDDNKKDFKHIDSYNNEKSILTMSIDVIFHLVETSVYIDYMKKLFEASEKYVIIYSSNKDENSTSHHVKHRKFTDWIGVNRKDFILIKFIPNKYPFNGNGDSTSFADFYIYEKRGF